MDLLELPLEAVAFRLYSLPTAAASASVWTCLAVVAAAAAAGLWRYRSSGTVTPPKPDVSSLGATTAQKSMPLSAAADETILEADQTSASGSPPASPSKIRFTTYYDGGGESCHCADDEEEEGGEDGEETTEIEVDDGVDGDVTGVVTAPWQGRKALEWDPLVVRRRGDLGWYRYQDLTALNGSVVRLWDGVDGGLMWSPRRRGGLGISVSSF